MWKSGPSSIYKIFKNGYTQIWVRIRSTFSVLKPLYLDSLTTPVLRPFLQSGLIFGRKVHVEVQFWSK